MVPPKRSSARSPKASPLSHFQRRTPMTSPLSHNHTSVLDSPISPYAQIPGPIQTVSSAPGQSIPSSPADQISPASHQVCLYIFNLFSDNMSILTFKDVQTFMHAHTRAHTEWDMRSSSLCTLPVNPSIPPFNIPVIFLFVLFEQ